MAIRDTDDKAVEVETPQEGARQLMFKGALEGFEDIIDTNYEGMNYVGYRLVHNPTIELDSIPSAYQKYESLSNAHENLLERPEEGAPLEDQYDYVAENALSFNDDDKALAAYWLGRLNDKKTVAAKEKFKQKKGDSIVKVYLDATCGLTEKKADEIGHRNFLPFDTFKLEEHIDAEYGYKLLESFNLDSAKYE